MASFAETGQLPLTPYTPKVDLNLYGQTLAYKQAQYDQNYQKIQGIVDSVGGIEVYNDTQKQYIQGKINNLTSQLNQISGADLSSNQVVSQANSLAASIYRDPVVQNAALSTQRIKKLQSAQKTLLDKHPEQYAAQNQWWDSQSVGKYLSSNDLNASYDGPTDPTRFVDINDVLSKKLKELSPNIQTKIDANGQFQYVVDKSSTVTPEQIEQVIHETMSSTPGMQQQATINGRYTYKDYSPEQLKQAGGVLFSDIESKYNQLVAETEQKKLQDPTNKELNDRYDETIKGLKSIKANSLNDLQRFFSSGDEFDQNAAKEMLYNKSLYSGFVHTFEKDNHEREIKTNDAQVAIAKMGVEKDRDWLSFVKAGIDPSTHLPIKPGDPLYRAHLKALNADQGILTDEQGNRQTVTVAPATPAEYTEAKNNENIQSFQTELDNRKGDLKDEFLKSVYGKGLTKDTPQFAKAFDGYYAQQQTKWDNNDPSVDPNFAAFKNNSQVTEQWLSLYKGMRDKTNEDAAKAFPTTGNFKEPITLHVGNTSATFHPNDTKSINDLMELRKVMSFVVGSGATAPKEAQDMVNSFIAGHKDEPFLINYLKYGKGSELDKALSPAMEQLGKQQEMVENAYSSFGKGKNYQAVPVTEKEASNLKSTVNSALSASGKDVIPEEALHVSSYYTDELGKLHIQYQEKGEKKMQEVEVISSGNAVNPSDPYMVYDQIIKNSPTNSTSLDPGSALHTRDNKLTYAISFNKITREYQPVLLDKGNKYPIPTKPGTMGYRSVGQVVQDMENLTSSNQPGLGRPYTREEIMQMLANQKL